MTATDRTRRVAILGGGIAALSCAWRLSADERIGPITVYQRGWRLGGKGASSRGANGRIEEHGLHVWLGYYDNAFRLMRQCYGELDRARTAPSCPIRTWRDAFAPSESVGLARMSSQGWEEWMAFFTPNDELPGEPTITTDPMSPAGYVSRAIRLVADFMASLEPAEAAPAGVVFSAEPKPPPSAGRLATLGGQTIDVATAATLEATTLALAGATTMTGPNPATSAAVALLEKLGDQLGRLVAGRPSAQPVFELLDLVVTSARGILSDGLLVDPRGFGAINGEEYRDWLRRHGAAPTTAASPLVSGVYDLVFGYRDGDPELPRFAAGTGLYLSAKLCFEYKGSIFWKMQAGMGDVVFAPLYQALRDRGVGFEFFHDVRALVPGPERTVDRVRLARQVDLADGATEYQPLELYDGLPCFPAEPRLDQLGPDHRQPAELHRRLDSVWGRDPAQAEVELTRGVDYDDLVFGLSLGMVADTCAQIVADDRRWQQMVRRLGTVATQSAQLWFGEGEDRLGWRRPGSTITGFVKPFDTVASMSHLLAAERWPPDDGPESLFYLCSTLAEPRPSRPDDGDDLRRQTDRVWSTTRTFLEDHIGHLLPGTSGPGGFDWSLLHCSDGGSGPDRLASQYVSANVDPSDRYVQSLPGTDRFRLRPDDSGYEGLYLAGDWTDCGLNAGCIEAAVISGLQAANAVLGHDRWDGISGCWTPLTGNR